MKDDEAWQSIGLKPFYMSATYTNANAAKHIPYSYVHIDKLSDHIIVSYDIPAGQHAPSTWQQEFAWALPNLYRNDPYDKLRIPMIESLKYMSVEFNSNGDDDDSGDGDDDSKWSQTSIALLVCFLFTSVCLAASAAYIFHLSRQLSQLREVGTDKPTTSSTATSLNPMSSNSNE